jgi:ketosteroid isomerase-like protein
VPGAAIIQTVPDLTLDEYEKAYLAFLEAWNRKDIATAFAALAPDCEWQSELSELGETGAWVGRDQITRFHQEWFELIADWRVDPVRVLQAGDDTFVTLDRGRGHGRGSGAPLQIDFATVVEIGDGMVRRVRQYSTWEEGLSAAGLDPFNSRGRPQIRSPSDQVS